MRLAKAFKSVSLVCKIGVVVAVFFVVGVGISIVNAGIIGGEWIDPSGGDCGTFYIHIDLNGDETLDNGECWRGEIGLVEKDGNVGIGTTDPNAILQVEKVQATTPLEIARFDNPGSGGSNYPAYITLGASTSGAKRYWNWYNFPGTGRRMSFAHGTTTGSLGTELFTILDSGYVGIGINNPSKELEVNGDILADNVYFSGGGKVPDFVFNDDYKLMPLNELEKSIKKNKHLPGIPSAEKVAENGLNLAEMHSNLLQKIEELTLYVIAQNKKIGLLEARLNNNHQ